MDQLQINATFPNIAPENLDDFKKLAAEGLEVTKGEEGTLQYDWFMSNDGSKCVLRETYASSDAALTHMGNMGELLGRIIELGGGIEIEVFGEPSEDLMAAGAALEPAVYSFLQGK